MSEAPTPIEALNSRLRHQRRELARLHKFHDQHKSGVPAPLGGYVEAEPLRESLREIIRRRLVERDRYPRFSVEWWREQNRVDGIKSAYGQIDATILGMGAKSKKKP